jgi:MORN repeat
VGRDHDDHKLAEMNIRTNLIRRALAVVLSVSVGAVPGLADAGQPTAFKSSDDCAADEPDSVQISWDSPCLTGAWLMDAELGCRMWDWHPTPDDGATWTGACLDGVKSGHGVLQWYEHGRPIDRFEGTFVAGRREGYGRYIWNESDWFAGLYSDDLPDGSGTASIAGEVLSGKWHLGCLAKDGKVVAISVPLSSCAHEDQLAAVYVPLNILPILIAAVPVPPAAPRTRRFCPGCRAASSFKP